MNEAERFLEAKQNRGKKPMTPSDPPRVGEGRAQVEPPPIQSGGIRSNPAPETGKWKGLKYPVAALTSIAVWLAFCFALAAMGMKGGAITFAIIFIVIIPAVWSGMLSLFKD
jgi:hypothetical protein